MTIAPLTSRKNFGCSEMSGQTIFGFAQSAGWWGTQISYQCRPELITVLTNGDLYLNAGGEVDGVSSGLIDPESLVTTVAAIVRRNPEIQVLVAGDEAVGYGHIYAAMVLLQKAGVAKVGLMSDPLDSLEGQGGG